MESMEVYFVEGAIFWGGFKEGRQPFWGSLFQDTPAWQWIWWIPSNEFACRGAKVLPMFWSLPRWSSDPGESGKLRVNSHGKSRKYCIRFANSRTGHSRKCHIVSPVNGTCLSGPQLSNVSTLQRRLGTGAHVWTIAECETRECVSHKQLFSRRVLLNCAASGDVHTASEAFC